MKGDFTRFTFNRKKHYHDVRMQQGRVQLDADWNEQMDITNHRTEAETADVIGCCGTSFYNNGFKIEADGADLKIDKGQYYVEGILCENEESLLLKDQTDLPGASTVVRQGFYLAYLDVWQRHITALDDKDIREVALGGPDTATRMKTVWQVKLSDPLDKEYNCCEPISIWEDAIAPGTGMMAAQVEKSDLPLKPCEMVAGGGYRGLENHLYRVEVHDGGLRNNASFKWSRENGSVIAKWESQDPVNENRLTVSGYVRDYVLQFSAGQWIELTDDRCELCGIPGTLVKLSLVEGAGDILVIDPATATGSVKISDFNLNPRIRRWEMSDEGLIKTNNADWIELEEGIFVKFEAGTYKSGDYWLIPARTAEGKIEWPTTKIADIEEPQSQLPHGITHHYCKLALLEFDGNIWTIDSDCRKLFPPVTELTNLLYVGGDGQEAMPGRPLTCPLQVRVVNGGIPVAGAEVQFSIEYGGGTLSSTGPVLSDASGIVSNSWTLGSEGKQRIKVRLSDSCSPISEQFVFFNADLSVASNVRYSPGCEYFKNKMVDNVQVALDELCNRKQTTGCSVTVTSDDQIVDIIIWLIKEGYHDFCMCLTAGDHNFEKNFQDKEFIRLTEELSKKKLSINLKIIGCGAGTRLHFKDSRFDLSNISSLVIRDISFEKDNAELTEFVCLKSIGKIEITSCTFKGIVNSDALLMISDAVKINIDKNEILSRKYKLQKGLSVALTSLEQTIKGEKAKGRSGKSGVFERIIITNPPKNECLLMVQSLCKSFLSKTTNVRKSMINKFQLQKEYTELEGASKIGISNLNKLLSAESVDLKKLTDNITNMREKLTIISPGNAIAIMDAMADTSISNNLINGQVILYGVKENDELKLPYEDLKNKRSKISYIGSIRTLHIHSNRMTRLLVSDQLIDQIIKNNFDIEGLFFRGYIYENEIVNGDNNFLSRYLYLSSNSFGELCAPIAGIAMGESIVYIGNHAIDPEHPEIPKTTIYNIYSRSNVGSANLEIKFDPSIAS